VSRVLTAFLRAIASQLHPRMLALLLGPFVIAVVFWLAVAWFVWDPLVDALRALFFGGAGPLDWIFARMAAFGLGDLKGAATALAALMLLVPVMLVSALLLVAIVSMPAVNLHLGAGAYRDVLRRGRWNALGSAGSALWASAVFVAGYVATLPLWLVPPLGFVVPWLWWGWLTARVMRYDSLVEHADPDELRELVRSNRHEYLALGLLVSALNYVPPLFLVTPVLGALAFGHYSLSRLRESRAAG